MRFAFCLVILAGWSSPVYSDAGPPPLSADSTVDDKPDLEWLIESLMITRSKRFEDSCNYLVYLKRGGTVLRNLHLVPANREDHIAHMEKVIRESRAKMRKIILQDLNGKDTSLPGR
jgi:hypothetical protein